MTNFGKRSFEDPEILKATLGIGYKQNLFVDGSTKWATGKGQVTFSDYMVYCLGDDYALSTMAAIKKILQEQGITVENMVDIPGFTDLDWDAYETARSEIERQRKERGTYRSPLQCETEAELVVLSSRKPFSFLTHSKNLKEIASDTRMLHWSPEIMYRFLSLHNTKQELSSLYACMIEDFYSCGFNVVSKDTLQAFTSPLFMQARQNLDQQKKTLGAAVESFASNETIAQHSRSFTLPLYAMQTSYHAARKAVESRDFAVAKMMEMERVASLTEKEKSEYIRLKNQKKDRMASKKKATKSKKRKKRNS